MVSGRPAATARRHAAPVLCAAHRPQQQPAQAAVDRRTLLTAAGAVLAGAALQQGQAAQADDCEFKTAASGMQVGSECPSLQGAHFPCAGPPAWNAVPESAAHAWPLSTHAVQTIHIMQYCDLAEGSGEAPVAGARIRAHYTGRLQSNGVVFDSSYERGRPLIFQVGVAAVAARLAGRMAGCQASAEGAEQRMILPLSGICYDNDT